MAIKKGIKIIAENRKAYHDYFIEERFEAGVALSGTEVKSLRAGRINLKDSYVQVKDGEMWYYILQSKGKLWIDLLPEVS